MKVSACSAPQFFCFSPKGSYPHQHAFDACLIVGAPPAEQLISNSHFYTKFLLLIEHLNFYDVFFYFGIRLPPTFLSRFQQNNSRAVSCNKLFPPQTWVWGLKGCEMSGASTFLRKCFDGLGGCAGSAGEGIPLPTRTFSVTQGVPKRRTVDLGFGSLENSSTRPAHGTTDRKGTFTFYLRHTAFPACDICQKATTAVSLPHWPLLLQHFSPLFTHELTHDFYTFLPSLLPQSTNQTLEDHGSA